MSTCIYASQGTISFCWDRDCDKTSKVVVLFVPHSDYSIKDGNKTLAVFVPQPKGDDKAILKAYDRDKGDKIKLVLDDGACKCPVLMDIVSYAATHQTNVSVRVKETKENDLKESATDALEKVLTHCKGAHRKSAVKVEGVMEKIIHAANAYGIGSSGLKLTGVTIPTK